RLRKRYAGPQPDLLPAKLRPAGAGRRAQSSSRESVPDQRADEPWIVWIYIRSWTVFLNAVAIVLGDIEIALIISVEVVDTPGTAGCDAELAPGHEQLSIEVVFQELLCEAISDPNMPVFRHPQGVGSENVFPLIDVVPVF